MERYTIHKKPIAHTIIYPVFVVLYITIFSIIDTPVNISEMEPILQFIFLLFVTLGILYLALGWVFLLSSWDDYSNCNTEEMRQNNIKEDIEKKKQEIKELKKKLS